MNGFIYAIGFAGSLVKIGHSADPWRRLDKLRSDCPSPLELIGMIAATRRQEAEAHELLSPWRADREWFRFEGAVVSFVQMLPKPRRPTIRRSLDGVQPGSLKAWIRVNTTQAAFARRVGCSEAHLSDLLSGRKMPSLQLAARMSAATLNAVPIDAFANRVAGPEPAEAAQ